NPVVTIRKQIAEPIIHHRVATQRDADVRANELLEMVGIPSSIGDRYPHQLSGGMRQRAVIAMALACEPGLILADEPTTALDVMIQAQILGLLLRLSEDLGLALVLVTHDIPLVSRSCGR